MALSQSVLSDLLDAFRAGEGVDLVRDDVRLAMQELIETEATEHVGAARTILAIGREAPVMAPKRWGRPKPSYVADWDELPAWQQETDVDIVERIEQDT